jgi:hypothetical protein
MAFCFYTRRVGPGGRTLREDGPRIPLPNIRREKKIAHLQESKRNSRVIQNGFRF